MRINDKIRAKEIRLIGDEGEQLGIHPLADALRIARERSTDLVEVAPNAEPPVCKLMDYGKYKYELTRKEREAKKHAKTVEIKEVRLSPKIDEHDLAIKQRTIMRLLEEGDKVKVSVRFKGRQMAYPQAGKQVLENVITGVRGIATPESNPLMEGRTMSMVLARAGARPAAAPRPRAEGADGAREQAVPSAQESRS